MRRSKKPSKQEVKDALAFMAAAYGKEINYKKWLPEFEEEE